MDTNQNMENNPTEATAPQESLTGQEQPTPQEKQFKLLKITHYNGSVNYIPHNRDNVKYHEEKKLALNKDKREKYKIETEYLTVEEAAELGVAEAYQILNPPKNKKQIANSQNDLMAQLLQQNQQLMNIILEERAAKAAEPTKTKK